MMTDLIILALQDEAPNLAKYKNVIFCGVGKINAAATTSEVIHIFRPRRIINFGTAGGITVGKGLHQCGRFIQRDMLCQPLGFQIGQTPYENDVIIETGQGLLCSSGDNFVTEKPTQGDVVDMEAYAIAKISKQRMIDFICYKYVTDSADNDAPKEWQQLVSEGEKEYLKIIEQENITLY